jgi:hypothetical protein
MKLAILLKNKECFLIELRLAIDPYFPYARIVNLHSMVSPELSPNTKTYTLPQIIQVLAQVELASDERTTIAQQILAWTNGQPELTECLAFRVLDVIPHNSDVGPPVELVNNQVRELHYV